MLRILPSVRIGSNTLRILKRFASSHLYRGEINERNSDVKMKLNFKNLNFEQYIKKEIELPKHVNISYLEIYDRIPLLDMNLPQIVPNIFYRDNPESSNSEKVIGDKVNNSIVSCKGGILKIRRKKMNKHKYKKRRKRDRAKIRRVLILRERRKKRIKARRKELMIEKINRLRENNPKDTYGERPYVIHRLLKW